MFPIIPLQLATNVAIAETGDDLDRYYGFDKLPPFHTRQPPRSLMPSRATLLRGATQRSPSWTSPRKEADS
jgi:hypothetical protein